MICGIETKKCRYREVIKMIKRNVILVKVDMGNTRYERVYSNFLKACKAELLPYHSLKIHKFPIVWRHISIDKLEVL
jgi:hypothetical protein